LRAVVSFHGALGAPDLPPPERVTAKVMVLHGWDDPLAPPADVMGLASELTAAAADWQLHAYGATMHSFMAEGLDAPDRGLQYNARSADRAWRAMVGLLAETLD
jgi:dienelactone hydrolase